MEATETTRPNPEHDEFRVDWELLREASRELTRAETHFRSVGRRDDSMAQAAGEATALADTAARILTRLPIIVGIRLEDAAAHEASEKDWHDYG